MWLGFDSLWDAKFILFFIFIILKSQMEVLKSQTEVNYLVTHEFSIKIVFQYRRTVKIY